MGLQPMGDEIFVASYDIDSVSKLSPRWRPSLPHLQVVGHMAATKRYDGLLKSSEVLSPHARYEGI